MSTFFDSLTDTIRNHICSYLSAYNNFYGGFTVDNLSPFNVFPVTSGYLAYRLFCNREPPAPPPPPFTGGQCAVTYNVAAVDRYKPNPTQYPSWVVDTNRSGTFTGPITAVQIERISSEYAELAVYHAGGRGVIGFLSSSPTIVNTYTLVSVNITRPGGLPDTCGDPPSPAPSPPSPSSGTYNVSYTDNSSNNVTVPVTLVLAPVRIDVNGAVQIPVQINVGGINVPINANANLTTGDITFNFGNNNYSPGAKGNPDSYAPDPSIPPVPDDVPDDVDLPDYDESADETQPLLRAAIVTVTDDVDTITEVFQGANPNVFVPRLGNIQFAIRVGNAVSWTEDIPVKNKRHFIPCPWEGGAVDVRGTPSPGVVWTITPVYARSDESIEFI